ncbi:hypothetical protein DPEC_G00305530 [Dallia pectoralis]|uniref:Uncharacterized protein n=1 Tax=Dallia pectoralis TaxID=75939 RepID=A0ACC2FDU6_DALPE|nr:hypothetical protein DPEC_G00305530 [Dallia pectoralis]
MLVKVFLQTSLLLWLAQQTLQGGVKPQNDGNGRMLPRAGSLGMLGPRGGIRAKPAKTGGTGVGNYPVAQQLRGGGYGVPGRVGGRGGITPGGVYGAGLGAGMGPGLGSQGWKPRGGYAGNGYRTQPGYRAGNGGYPRPGYGTGAGNYLGAGNTGYGAGLGQAGYPKGVAGKAPGVSTSLAQISKPPLREVGKLNALFLRRWKMVLTKCEKISNTPPLLGFANGYGAGGVGGAGGAGAGYPTVLADGGAGLAGKARKGAGVGLGAGGYPQGQGKYGGAGSGPGVVVPYGGLPVLPSGLGPDGVKSGLLGLGPDTGLGTGAGQLPYNGVPVNTAGLEGDVGYPYAAQHLGMANGDGGKSASKYGNGGGYGVQPSGYGQRQLGAAQVAPYGNGGAGVKESKYGGGGLNAFYGNGGYKG